MSTWSSGEGLKTENRIRGEWINDCTEVCPWRGFGFRFFVKFSILASFTLQLKLQLQSSSLFRLLLFHPFLPFPPFPPILYNKPHRSKMSRFLRKIAIKALQCGTVPQHVGFIMDGNRRYGRKVHVGNDRGYYLGYETLEEVGVPKNLNCSLPGTQSSLSLSIF